MPVLQLGVTYFVKWLSYGRPTVLQAYAYRYEVTASSGSFVLYLSCRVEKVISMP